MNWNDHREQIIKMLEENKQPDKIAELLNVPVYDLRQFIHRERLFLHLDQGRNLALELVRMKFIHPEFFKPTRRFYIDVGIGQRRWYLLLKGREKMTEDEYKRISSYFGVTLQEAFEARQINFLEEIDN
jgi:hypothetical protein